MLYGFESGGEGEEKQGPIISFNLLHGDSSFVGYAEVERLASLEGIHVRTGCFCNPGACQHFLSLTSKEVKENLDAGHVCWDDKDIINGKPTGAVRISAGYSTSFEDIHAFLSFLRKYFVQTATNISLQVSHSTHVPNLDIFLSSICLYPIKSCAGFHVESWEISKNG